MVSLTKKVDRLYIVIAVLFALCLTTITLCAYFVFSRKTRDNDESDHNDQRCVIVQKVQPAYPKRIERVEQERDMRVLTDPLYPAYNRSEYDIHNSVVDAIERKQLFNNTREANDRFRLVAYVSSNVESQDAGGNKWKLIARMKDRNQAEFFLVPVDKNYDMKIMLNNDIVVGERLRDVYTIPKQLTFKTPLLHEQPYDVVELPMTDFTSTYH